MDPDSDTSNFDRRHRDAVEYLDPKPLREHPFHKWLPKPAQDSAEWHAFVDGIQAAGPKLIPPIQITSEGFVVDGERRRLAALQWQWPLIACMVVPDSEAKCIIFESLIGQRHLTLGAKALLALEMWPEYAEEAHRRQVERLKKGTKIYVSTCHSPFRTQCGTEPQAFMARVGCTQRLFEQAVALSKAFKATKTFEIDGQEMTLKDYYWPKIFDAERPMGLGRALEGMGYNKEHERWSSEFRLPNGVWLKPRSPEHNACLHLSRLGTPLSSYGQWPEPVQALAYQQMQDMVDSADDAATSKLKLAIKTKARRQRRKKDAAK